MKALIQNIDVLDLPADALIYSTNGHLNCTGGVGAALKTRYGARFQDDLHAALSGMGKSCALQGEVLQHVPSGLPYKKLFHTVPCDAYYNSSAVIIRDILRQCLLECVESGAVSDVVLSALATGYGKLEYELFFHVAASVLGEFRFRALSRVTICIADACAYHIASQVIQEEALPLGRAEELDVEGLLALQA